MKVYYLVQEDKNADSNGYAYGQSYYHIKGMYLSEKSAIKAMQDLIESHLNQVKLCPPSCSSYDLLINKVPTLDEIRSAKEVHVSIEHTLGSHYRNTFYYDWKYLEW